MNGSVIILTGPPGAGKSTVALRLSRRYDMAVHLHTDDFYRYIVSGAIPPYDPASDAQNQTVMGVITAAAFGYALGGFTTVVDGIIGPWMLHHFRVYASRHPDAHVHYVVLRPRRDVALGRAQSRTGPDALVDHDPILTMWDQFGEMAEFNDHVLDTSDEGADRSVERVAEALRSNQFRLPSA